MKNVDASPREDCSQAALPEEPSILLEAVPEEASLQETFHQNEFLQRPGTSTQHICTTNEVIALSNEDELHTNRSMDITGFSDDSDADPTFNPHLNSESESESSSEFSDEETERPNVELGNLKNKPCENESKNQNVNETEENTEQENEAIGEQDVPDIMEQENEGDGEIENPEKDKRVKKKKQAPKNWKKNVVKQLRNSGQAYTSVSKSKKTFDKKSLKQPCGDKCRLQCSSKFTNEERQKILDEYWSLGDIEKQRSFLLKNMITVNPKYRYKREGSHRKENKAFYYNKDGKQIRVCKKFFMATLDISSRPLRTVINKTSTTTEASVAGDMRGKHGNHFKVPDAVKDGIRRHIESIPRIESHYCRSNTSREFIDGGKSIADLHRDYIKQCQETHTPYSDSYLMYNQIFNTEYNISFFTPKKDQCETCVAYSNADTEEKKKMTDKYESHILEKDLTRVEKDNDKKNENKKVVVAVYDLQAVMPVPKGEVSTFYYVSKVNVLNFTIYDIKTNEVSCFMWHEGEAKRGSNEIASCVLRYLYNLKEKMKEDDVEGLDVILYSDNCGGQQKNRYLISMYLYAVANYDHLNSITHKYLITGHSQNEGDSAHSLIERAIKKSLKSGPIYVPEQYVSVVRTVKKNGKPFKVNEVTHEDIWDFKELTSHLGKNFSRNEDDQRVMFNDIKQIRVEKDKPLCYFYKVSYSDEEYGMINLEDMFEPPEKRRKVKKKRCKQTPTPIEKVDMKSLTLKKAYKGKFNIAETKKRGLLSLVKKNVIPSFYKRFYENL